MARTREYPGTIRRKGNRWEVRVRAGGLRHEFTRGRFVCESEASRAG